MGQEQGRIRVEIVDDRGPRTVHVPAEEVLGNPVMLAQVVCRIHREVQLCSDELLRLNVAGIEGFWDGIGNALKETWKLDQGVDHG